MSKTKHTLRTIKTYKDANESLHMLTCYDYQTAQMLNETEIDLLLVGDSLGNVMLGLPTTIPVTTEQMSIFGRAVTRGAPDKFVVVDMPFGSYAYYSKALDQGIKLFQQTQCQALKVEGANDETLKAIKTMTENGIPVMGHIGLTPQSVHQMGGYYTHGKEDESIKKLKHQAKALVQAGCFSLVLECVEKSLATEITQELPIPTIGIGSGENTNGQVLVINDLLKMGKDRPPKFCRPIADLYEHKKNLIEKYLSQ